MFWRIPNYLGSSCLRSLILALLFAGGVLLYLALLGMAAGLFYQCDVLLFGAEQIVGALNVHYHEDGFFYYTNPMAMLFRHLLYFGGIAALTWGLAAGCEWLWRYRHRTPVLLPKSRGRRLLFAILLAGVAFSVGTGVRAWGSMRDAALWSEVGSLKSVAEYEAHFGKPAYHLAEVKPEDLEWIADVGRMRDREFALGKEVFFFGTAWPFRWFLVWQQDGTIIKTTWCSM